MLRREPPEVLAEADRESWFSTIGLLTILTWYKEYRRRSEHKELAQNVLRVVLETTCEPDVLRQVLLTLEDGVAPGACRIGAGGTARCDCWRQVMTGIDKLAKSQIQSQVVSVINVAFASRKCEHTAQVCLRMLLRIAEHIESRTSIW